MSRSSEVELLVASFDTGLLGLLSRHECQASQVQLEKSVFEAVIPACPFGKLPVDKTCPYEVRSIAVGQIQQMGQAGIGVMVVFPVRRVGENSQFLNASLDEDIT